MGSGRGGSADNKHMRYAFLALFAVFACVGAGPLSASPTQELVAIVRDGLTEAPSHFAASLGKPYASFTDERRYHTLGALGKLCAQCRITDEYADTGTDERWVLTYTFTAPKSWSNARVAEYVETTLGPMVRDFTLKTGDDEGATYFDWKRGKTFLYVRTYGKSNDHLVEVRIGRYTATNVHRAKFSTPLTDAQKAHLTDDIKNFLSVGLANAPQNFVTLRGKSYGSHVFDATMSFDDLFTACGIEGYLDDLSSGKKWVMECDTPYLADDKATLEPFIADTIWNALPGSFAKASDSARGWYDYRWDWAESEISVMLTSEKDGSKTEYEVRIYHFIP